MAAGVPPFPSINHLRRKAIAPTAGAKRPERFPLLHTPDGGYLNSEINALH